MVVTEGNLSFLHMYINFSLYSPEKKKTIIVIHEIW